MRVRYVSRQKHRVSAYQLTMWAGKRSIEMEEKREDTKSCTKAREFGIAVVAGTGR